jgi:hypothetical protein
LKVYHPEALQYEGYQLLAQGRWFSVGTPASPTTKTGRHDIAEILLKMALNTKIQIQIQILLRQAQWVKDRVKLLVPVIHQHSAVSDSNVL